MTDEAGLLARRQLLDLVEVAGGAVELLEERKNFYGNTVFTISMDTSGLVRGPNGITVRPRERFKVIVPNGFPFEPPSVVAVHNRWAKTPHVQWGSSLCLYASSSVEWNPSDGIRGLISRLSTWVEHAAAGTLDPDGQPLHPPAVYTSADAGIVLVHPDLGDRVPWASDGAGSEIRTLIAWCAADTRQRRVDVLEWVDLATATERADAGDAEVFVRGHPVVAVPVVLTPDEFGFEYPADVKALSQGLSESGYDRDSLLLDLAAATVLNRKLRVKQKAENPGAAGVSWDESELEDGPLLTAVLVGTPSRRVEGETRLAHLAAWKLDGLSSMITDLFARVRDLAVADLEGEVRDLAFSWFDSAKIAWMQVMETRPEVTRRRDQGTPLSWLAGKRALVLGAGALGAPVAEMCVRAGVRELTVADRSLVTPGILVRQPYTDADIGQWKASALSERLSSIRPDVTVTPSVGNVRTTFFAPGRDLSAFDLIIDATADASVRSAIEKARREATIRPPLITMVIGHDARRGLVTTNLTSATGAGADTFRKVALLASSRAQEWTDVGDDLFPTSPRTQLFFPEPGCSAPTFVGSAAQTTALAGAMLSEALTVLSRRSSTGSTADTPVSSASAVRLGSASSLGTSRAEWPADVVQVDGSNSYEVRISAEALAEARAESRRGARTRGPEIETGGMLLGAFDDATGIVYVDKVAGPPPDSYLAEMYFQHGVEGVQERVDTELERTGRATGFVGFWHTHPAGPARPSPTDEHGMASVVGPDGTTRRALMMILGGSERRWAGWLEGAAGEHPDLYLRVVPRSAGPVVAGHPGYVGGTDLQRLPAGTYFRGGYSPRIRVAAGGRATHVPAGRSRVRWLWRWQRS
ncbi:ThiF family adenylyltransferase [Parafrankia sp. FMc2]|uniref:ThiF family adenylyltransferase n=1 Tax=Parafrankia sp. FMc2 TaxID=3233196 RepID=UPI0034D4EAA5